jgi:hypothetical protein
MRSTRRFAATIAVAAISISALGGCTSGAKDEPLPVFENLGSRLREYDNLNDLARYASAIVVVESTGERSEVAFPISQGGTKDSAPTEFYTLKVDEVLSGSLDAKTIQVVSPGIDENTGKSALARSGQMVLFITPAMYAADQPVGGYAIVGGPSGMFVKSGSDFLKVDSEAPGLPKSVDKDTTKWPQITKTEKQLLHEGP